MHCDDPERFRLADTIRLHPPGVMSIVAAGIFDESRWPQILDLEEVCRRLNQTGISVRATILATRITEEGYRRVKACRFVELQDAPGHMLLPSYLKGADVLYLPETFDPIAAQGYRYSISTKAHLFMFSQRPILVYGHPANGLVIYADRERWGHVVDQRNVDMLEGALKELLVDDGHRQRLVAIATTVAMKNNDCNCTRKIFLKRISATLRES
jgi:glycosyltransferase involved in cell wall biosynthesis